LLIRITDEWVKQVTDRDIWRPAVSAVNAVGIKELRPPSVLRANMILEAVPGAVGVVDRGPLFITAVRRSDKRP
jgi:hypothetical protein